MINTVIFHMDLFQNREIQQLAYITDFIIVNIDKLKIVLKSVIFQERNIPDIVMGQVKDTKIRWKNGES